MKKRIGSFLGGKTIKEVQIELEKKEVIQSFHNWIQWQWEVGRKLRTAVLPKRLKKYFKIFHTSKLDEIVGCGRITITWK